MNTRMSSSLIRTVIVALGMCRLLAVETPEITGTKAELTASELASALGIRSWSYRLRFDKMVAGVSVQLCELRRQPDGSWQRSSLSDGYGFHDKAVANREVPVTVLIHDKETGENDFGLRLGGDFTRLKLSQQPDFSRTYSKLQEVRFISGCLVLAIEARDATRSADEESDMVRIIGLEIKTE